MIPKIISITEESKNDEVIEQFALQYDIDPAHRIVVQPEKDELTVEQIHLMRKDIQVAFSKKVLVVLLGVDNSSAEVQNSLLKSLEEESERIQFLLLVKAPFRLLSTILSRCATVTQKLVVHEPLVSDDYVDMFSFQKNTDVTKEEAVEKIDNFVQSSSLNRSRVLRHILHIRKLIMDNNMNPVLALDTILIFLSKHSTIKVIHEK